MDDQSNNAAFEPTETQIDQEATPASRESVDSLCPATPPSDGGASSPGQKPTAKQGGTKRKQASKQTNTAGSESKVQQKGRAKMETNFLHRVMLQKLRLFMGTDDAAKSFRNEMLARRGTFLMETCSLIALMRKWITK